jgi:hypothetical protein
MAGELLQAIPQVDQAKMAGANDATAGRDKELAAAHEHGHAGMVEVRAGHFCAAAHANVVAGVGAATATAVRRQQVVPAVAINDD